MFGCYPKRRATALLSFLTLQLSASNTSSYLKCTQHFQVIKNAGSAQAISGIRRKQRRRGSQALSIRLISTGRAPTVFTISIEKPVKKRSLYLFSVLFTSLRTFPPPSQHQPFILHLRERINAPETHLSSNPVGMPYR